MPRSAFVRILSAWDSVGSAPFIMDAVDEGISELAAALRRGTAWEADEAEEVLTFAICRRISLRPPSMSTRVGFGDLLTYATRPHPEGYGLV